MQELRLENRAVEALVPYAMNARLHSPEQVTQIAESIRDLGYNDPVTIDQDNGIITGHGTVLALQELGIQEIQVIVLSHLSERQKKAYILAHNRIAQNSKWDMEKLSHEINELVEMDFPNLDMIGFDEQELEAMLKTDPGILPDNFDDPDKIEPPVEKGRRKSKSKLVHKCPHCGQEFSA
jgi:ParB-like chromosome segregation protein Spo0J